jgi:serine/threonine-protein kinase
MKRIGRYEIVEELGRGAMGVVYKASDPTIGRMVAIKVLILDDKPEDGGPGTRNTFLREARAAGRLSHPGIVTIHDALEDESTRTSYIVMEYIPGRTLEKILISTPRIGAEQAFDISRQVAEALDYAHRNQIIHRDLKPANIILTEDGRAKITDFGIAKIAAQGAMRTVAIMGTPSYMSPEQVTGGEIDARADIFSLGILLYLMLVGEKPFAGDTAAVMFKIVYEDPVLPSRVNPKLTASDDYVVLRCLAKDRSKRYSSAREFLDDLEDLRHGRPPRSQARVPPSEFQAAERTVAAVHPLIPPPRAAGPVATSPALPTVPASAATPVPPPAGETIAPAPAPPAAGPVSAPAPTAAPGVPMAATAAPGRKPSVPLVGGIAALLVALIVGVGIWLSRRPSTPPTLTPEITVGALAPAPAAEGAAVPNSAHTGPSQPTTAGKEGSLKSPPSAGKPSATRAEPGAAPPKEYGPLGATGDSASKAAPEPSTASDELAAAASPFAPVREITVYCKHEFQDATLLLLDGSRTVYQARLAGKKKRGFIGIGGKGFSGTLTETVTIPGDTKELTVRVYSSDGAVNVLHTISAHPPSDDLNTLRITPAQDQLKLEWAKSPGTKK